MGTLGISLNLVTYLVQKMHLAVPRAANIVTNYYGTSYILSLLGGFLADSYWGRFRTVVVFASIQLIVSNLNSLEEVPYSEPSVLAQTCLVLKFGNLSCVYCF